MAIHLTKAGLYRKREIVVKRNEIRREHLSNIGKNHYSIQNGMYYNDLFSACEEVGDYLFNISQTITEDK